MSWVAPFHTTDRLLLQSASGITKCGNYYKVRRNTPALFKPLSLQLLCIFQPSSLLWSIARVLLKNSAEYENLRVLCKASWESDSLITSYSKLTINDCQNNRVVMLSEVVDFHYFEVTYPCFKLCNSLGITLFIG